MIENEEVRLIAALPPPVAVDEEGKVIYSEVADKPPPGLANRLMHAMELVQPLVLDGYNAFHKYHYPTIAQVRDKAGEVLTAVGVAIVPSIVRVGRATRTSEKGKTISITAIEMEIAVCSDEGAYIARWAGESEDTGDKGIQKAASAALKAWLTNLLLIPVVEPENDEGEPGEPSETAKDKPALHWIKYARARGRFWRWCREDLALSNEEVHQALGVERIEEYGGTMADAKAAILAWVDKQKEAGGEREPATDTSDV